MNGSSLDGPVARDKEPRVGPIKDKAAGSEAGAAGGAPLVSAPEDVRGGVVARRRLDGLVAAVGGPLKAHLDHPEQSRVRYFHSWYNAKMTENMKDKTAKSVDLRDTRSRPKTP